MVVVPSAGEAHRGRYEMRYHEIGDRLVSPKALCFIIYIYSIIVTIIALKDTKKKEQTR